MRVRKQPSVARIKAERSRKLARRTSRRLIQQRDGEHGPKAGEVEHQSLRSRVRASRQAHGEHRALAWLARYGHIPAHHARELAGDGEPKPGFHLTIRRAFRCGLDFPEPMRELIEDLWPELVSKLPKRPHG